MTMAVLKTGLALPGSWRLICSRAVSGDAGAAGIPCISGDWFLGWLRDIAAVPDRLLRVAGAVPDTTPPAEAVGQAWRPQKPCRCPSAQNGRQAGTA